ncbi:MAG: patatin-like phospholipase family protein [Parasutterella sp.]
MKVGLALGSGSARGFSHIGIIDCLLDQGIVPDVVAGTSIGSIVGACFVTGHLDRLRKQALAINRLNWTTFSIRVFPLTAGSICIKCRCSS